MPKFSHWPTRSLVWSPPPLSPHLLLFSISCTLASLLSFHLGRLHWLFPWLESSPRCHMPPSLTSFPAHFSTRPTLTIYLKFPFSFSESHNPIAVLTFLFTISFPYYVYLSVLPIKIWALRSQKCFGLLYLLVYAKYLDLAVIIAWYLSVEWMHEKQYSMRRFY